MQCNAKQEGTVMEPRFNVLRRYGIEGEATTCTREIDYLADQIANAEASLVDKLEQLKQAVDTSLTRLKDNHLPSPTVIIDRTASRVAMLTTKLVVLDDLMSRAVEDRMNETKNGGVRS